MDNMRARFIFRGFLFYSQSKRLGPSATGYTTPVIKYLPYPCVQYNRRKGHIGLHVMCQQYYYKCNLGQHLSFGASRKDGEWKDTPLRRRIDSYVCQTSNPLVESRL